MVASWISLISAFRTFSVMSGKSLSISFWANLRANCSASCLISGSSLRLAVMMSASFSFVSFWAGFVWLGLFGWLCLAGLGWLAMV